MVENGLLTPGRVSGTGRGVVLTTLTLLVLAAVLGGALTVLIRGGETDDSRGVSGPAALPARWSPPAVTRAIEASPDSEHQCNRFR
jgi:hypothetical protein